MTTVDRNMEAETEPSHAEVASADLDSFSAYRDVSTLARVSFQEAAFPRFFSPRPAPMTLTLAR